MTKYCVIITNYEDDYKHRYDNGIYRDKPKKFNSLEETDEFINDYIYEFINSRFYSTIKAKISFYYR